MNSPLLVGFVASFTLIAAIGAQNAFVLRQGIRREHVLPVVALCTVSDIALIAAGIAGVGALINAHPGALNVAKFGGALFLFGYGILAARRAWRPSALNPSDATPARLAEVLVTCAALTFLNPTSTSTLWSCSVRSPTSTATAAGCSASAPSPPARCGSSASASAHAGWPACSPRR